MVCVRKEDRPIFPIRSYRFQETVQPHLCLTYDDVKHYEGNWFGHFVSGSWAQCLDPYVEAAYKFTEMDPKNSK